MLGGKGRGRLPSRPAASPTSWSCRRHPAPWGSPRSQPCRSRSADCYSFYFQKPTIARAPQTALGASTPELGKISDLAHQGSGRGGPSLLSVQGQALAPGAWLWAASRPPLSSDPRGSPGSAHRCPFSTARLQGEFEGDHPRQARTRPTSMLALVPRGILVTCINSSQSL